MSAIMPVETTGTPCDFPLFDAHFHVIDPRFPLIANNGYVPDAFTCRDYRRRLQAVPVTGGAVVAGSFQGIDQTWLEAALAELGPGFVGVTQLPHDVTDARIRALDAAGVRAVRFNLKRCEGITIDTMDRLAWRVHDVAGWHVEIYADAANLKPWVDTIAAWPATSIDHLGLTTDGLPVLLELAGRGVHVKATGFGRVDMDVPSALKAIHAANPEAMMFGTDLPSTRAPRPYRHADLALVIDTLGATAARMVLHDNAVAFYHPRLQSTFDNP